VTLLRRLVVGLLGVEAAFAACPILEVFDVEVLVAVSG
jgi:hypothetical protein